MAMENTITSLIISFLLILSSSRLPFSIAKQKMIMRSGIYEIRASMPVSFLHNINSPLFSHLICGYAQILNNSMHQISLTPQEEDFFSNFTKIVKIKNPNIVTLMSIAGWNSNFSLVSSMMSNITSRASFIQSSIKLARSYGFDGLDFLFKPPGEDSEISDLASLLHEWKEAIKNEAMVSNATSLILTLHVRHSPYLLNYLTYSIDTIMNSVDWLHLLPSLSNTYFPNNANNTSAHAALFNPDANGMSVDKGIRSWINQGCSVNRLVIGLPYYGYGWRLVQKEMNYIGAPSNGSANEVEIEGGGGWISYRDVKEFVRSNERKNLTSVAKVIYNSTYAMNYVAIGSTWIGYDDVESVRAKVDYARNKGLLGYYAFQIDYDDADWTLSRAADSESQGKKQRESINNILMIILPTVATTILLFGFLGWCIKRRCHISKDLTSSKTGMNNGTQSPNLNIDFSYATIQTATNNFSEENKLGEGGYGPVYKGKLKNGDEIAVKRLSKSSSQGFEEFKNEVELNAKLQHVNLVKVLGFCIEKEDKMLIYEFMPNKSLDHYLYDSRKVLLKWDARVQIIEGITHGLLYLQEYSRITVIHRDIKASNILLDIEMKAKISDFGLARIFKDNELEAITGQVVGTRGHVPPEYIYHGIYSTKSDVYGFGVLLLQIISGKQINNCRYGAADESLNLLEYAYELWREDKGRDFVDAILDDTCSPYKLTKFLQVALLCVQESASDRPHMLEISSMLRNETVDIKTPKRPAFSTKGDAVSNKSYLANQEIDLSNNDFSSTGIVAR